MPALAPKWEVVAIALANGDPRNFDIFDFTLNGTNS